MLDFVLANGNRKETVAGQDAKDNSSPRPNMFPVCYGLTDVVSPGGSPRTTLWLKVEGTFVL